jgi:D-alanine--poly(phosphoribitol) ligase subunit 1
MMIPDCNPARSLYATALRQPDSLALSASGTRTSYDTLARYASGVAALVQERATLRPDGASAPRVGVLATRSLEAYAGILGAAWAGGTYVPLNLKWPEDRLIALLGTLELSALVVDVNGAKLLTPAVLAAAPELIIIADKAAVAVDAGRAAPLRLSETLAPAITEPVPVDAGHMAYIMFTSGTTGLPKGVMIPAGAIAEYLEQARGWTAYRPDDRVGETCDITFDLTVHQMYLCFEAGAALYVMSQLEMMAPQRFIRSNEITVWMSVPTVLSMMRKTGALQPGIFPSLRLSIFCGEPLPVPGAQAWAQAGPHGMVENIYGPTEATVACIRQTLTEPVVATESRDIVAIGRPFATTGVEIFDEAMTPCGDDVPGEIALSGPQLAIGYFNAPEQTDARFRMVDGVRWYMTGDLGCRDADGIFHHLGRIDNQIKLKGNRVELEEVEMHLRAAAGTDLAATVAWPVHHGSAEGLVGFVCGMDISPETVTETMLTTLPRYMVPNDIRVIDDMPRNLNGKIDRRALFDRLENEAAVSLQPQERHRA